MTRIRFENAPSTNTPINADNLNKLNNVVISSSEPTTGEEVWFKKNDTEKKIYVKNDNGVYEEFINSDEIKKRLYFSIGEKYFFSKKNMVVAGNLTSSQKIVQFYIPFPKNTNNLSVNELYIVADIRHADGGYITQNIDLSTIGTYDIRLSEYGLYIGLSLNTASTFTNNAPCSVYIYGQSYVTFKE